MKLIHKIILRKLLKPSAIQILLHAEIAKPGQRRWTQDLSVCLWRTPRRNPLL